MSFLGVQPSPIPTWTALQPIGEGLPFPWPPPPDTHSSSLLATPPPGQLFSPSGGLPSPWPPIPNTHTQLFTAHHTTTWGSAGGRRLRVWHKRDATFNVPKAVAYFALRTARAAETPRAEVLSELFVELVKDYFTEAAYMADLAGLEYTLYGGAVGDGGGSGLIFSVRGFSEKLPRFVEDVAWALRLDPTATTTTATTTTAAAAATGADAAVDAAAAAAADAAGRFAVAFERITRKLRNQWIKPERHARDLRVAALCPGPTFAPDEKLAALLLPEQPVAAAAAASAASAASADAEKGGAEAEGGSPAVLQGATVTLEEVIAHGLSLGSADDARLDVFAMGNVSAEETVALAEKVAEIMQVGVQAEEEEQAQEQEQEEQQHHQQNKVVADESSPLVRRNRNCSCVVLPGGDAAATEVRLTAAARNPKEGNHCAEAYWQLGPATVHSYGMAELLEQVMFEPCFDSLRTKQALGYTVRCGSRLTRGVAGFAVTVKGSAVSAADADARIEGFMDRFAAYLDAGGDPSGTSQGKDKDEDTGTNGGGLSDADFAAHRDSLVSQKMELDDSLGDEAYRHWAEIVSGRATASSCGFQSHEREAAFLRTVTKAQFVAFYRRHFLRGGAGRRRLSVQVSSAAEPTGYDGAPPGGARGGSHSGCGCGSPGRERE